MTTHPQHPEPEGADAPPQQEQQELQELQEATAEAASTRPEPRPTDDHATALDELQDRWRRALADIENLRKRHAKELDRERASERASTAAALLPILDGLELALSHADSDPGAIVEGVKAVHDQAVAILGRLGYERHAETGVPFDPSRHEVVGVVDDPDVEPGTVAKVMRPGYGEAERQLRPVAVTVGKRRE
ncbi:nucleotide exchange factor GrpE [Streptomyces sp. NBC_01750]|uniref:nucleotide exchange factor GrpE n=1 Tax=Streptomyces sp. NBC_01750 TaxID=2975928 RepID=UPI002DD8C368|nr:nucleotide exchange factor GrpE [Streptomyces sp. NBC_01750]WSD31093.1 nucleotide exchange factor GrpE [Streptomyces sp. NBC_01750]